MNKSKNKKSPTNKEIDFGICEFKCINCNHQFEVPWKEIFELQEITHGFVSYDYMNNDYIACPKCYANATKEYCASCSQNFDSVGKPKDNAHTTSSEELYNGCVIEIDDDSIPF
jgi:DNA-directed RNA polymerase subunit RPC12/RpoP